MVRRNLQREHLKELTNLVLGKKPAVSGGGMHMMSFGPSRPIPPDARSLARMHLRDILKRITQALSAKEPVRDDTTRAHLEECQERIAKVLSASMQVNEP